MLQKRCGVATASSRTVPAPDFSPGERVFKPARTLYLAMTGLWRSRTDEITPSRRTLRGDSDDRSFGGYFVRNLQSRISHILSYQTL